MSSGAPPGPHPPVRTYHARSGRLSPAKRAALAELCPRLAPPGLANAPGPVPAWALCGRPAPTLLEIGAGTGEAALSFASAHPRWNVVAVEVHRASLANLARRAHELDLPNVWLVGGDAVALLAERVAEGGVDRIRAFFPDPWPKAAHRHRRLVAPARTALLARRLTPGGLLELATDHAGYAAAMAAALDAEPLLLPVPGAGRADRPVTYYERRAAQEGRGVVDLCYRRLLSPERPGPLDLPSPDLPSPGRGARR